MAFKPESLMSTAMLIFGKERVVSVLTGSPLHTDDVAVVELFSAKNSYEGGICLRDLLHFAGMVNLDTSQVWIKEQGPRTVELWLLKPKKHHSWDDEPTPVDPV